MSQCARCARCAGGTLIVRCVAHRTAWSPQTESNAQKFWETAEKYGKCDQNAVPTNRSQRHPWKPKVAGCGRQFAGSTWALGTVSNVLEFPVITISLVRIRGHRKMCHCNSAWQFLVKMVLRATSMSQRGGGQGAERNGFGKERQLYKCTRGGDRGQCSGNVCYHC